jgi:hypothetical protein
VGLTPVLVPEEGMAQASRLKAMLTFNPTKSIHAQIIHTQKPPTIRFSAGQCSLMERIRGQVKLVRVIKIA